MTTGDPAVNVETAPAQRFGRTWPDIFHPLVLLLVLVAILWALKYFEIFDVFKQIPLWVVVAILMSLIFLPWLISEAKAGAQLVVVMDDIETLSEWRIGSHYPIDIDGVPLNFFSRSGVRRIFLSTFDPDTRSATAYIVPGGSPFDFIRDGNAFIRLSSAYSRTLREEQIVKEMVGVEAQRAGGRVADQMLRILYGSMDLSELEEALTDIQAVPLEDEDLTTGGLETEIE